MKIYFSSTLFWGIISLIVIPNVIISQDLPLILSSKTMPTESGVKLEFVLSSYIKKDDRWSNISNSSKSIFNLWLLKRTIFKKLHYFNTSYKCSADYDIYYKVLLCL